MKHMGVILSLFLACALLSFIIHLAVNKRAAELIATICVISVVARNWPYSSKEKNND